MVWARQGPYAGCGQGRQSHNSQSYFSGSNHTSVWKISKALIPWEGRVLLEVQIKQMVDQHIEVEGTTRVG